MATTRTIFTRSLLTTKRTLSSLLSRSYSSPAVSLSSPPPSSLSSSVLRLRPLVAVAANFHRLSPASTARGYSTRRTSSSLNDPNPNWSNRPPKETILLDGCDFEHWLVVVEKPEGDPTRDEIIDGYIKTLAEEILRSYLVAFECEDEARMKIYSVSTRHYFAFGALVSEELSYKLKELRHVRWVLPDSYLDVRNKDYGGEPFINGQAVPYDPKYHEEWVRNNAKANDRNRRNDRPRNFDRSRNFERRGNRDVQNPPGSYSPNNMTSPPNMAGPPPGNMGGPPNMGGMPQSNMGGQTNMGGGMPQNNRGGAPPQYNTGGVQPQYNTGGVQPQYNTGGGQPPYNTGGGQPPYNTGAGMPQTNMGGNPQYNTGRGPQNNMGGPPNNMGGPPNNTAPPNFQYGPNNGGMPYQNREMSGPGQNREYQHNNFAPNSGVGNPYQTQDMPGRDMPPPPNYQ
ncbi:hypothetical protein RHSIM_Rhsim06G0205800 [Rhododendron simsii]|uniref:MORF/ORRM1/DAG-like MORF domain-containing protein n=1 Tax=Rhododendron simsii TaxID=118357 RepID=A0A834LKK6_RHOSS|nr:hypothetical protein RHSIM_Rhsim06G0205800 [Rhododendron simsii]